MNKKFSIKIYGIDNLMNDFQTNLGFKPNNFFRFAWKYLCPIIVIFLIILSLTYSDELKYGHYSFPSWSITLGWCINMTFILPIPIIIIYVFIRYSDPKKSFKERIHSLFIPTITKQRLKKQNENGRRFLMSSISSKSYI
jgi:solute carrier family 6 amino acid transporter-like protein 5/7/9/14